MRGLGHMAAVCGAGGHRMRTGSGAGWDHWMVAVVTMIGWSEA